MTTRTCSLDYCDREHSAHDYCQAHYQQIKRGEQLRPLKVIHKVCTLDWCDRPHSGLGYCEAHREQFKAGKPLAPIRQQRVQSETCLHCDEKPKARDLCAKHYNEMTRRANGMLPREVRESLNKALRVTSDKPKRNDKPKPAKPERNPKLPKGWEVVRDKKPQPRVQTSSNGDLSGDFGPVGPIDADLAAAMRARLARRGALDLAEMLGVAS